MEAEIKKKIAVIGGLNMDIGGSPAGELIMRDSNPGTVSIRPGGVGRNIAHNLRLLGAEVSLISALGGDFYSVELLKHCGEVGIDMSMSLFMPDSRCSLYLYVTDKRGEMELAISQMDLMDKISPAFLSARMERINKLDAVVADGNLSRESIAYLCENCTVPIYADPVSVSKAAKLEPFLGSLRAIKPNELEAEAMSGEKEPERAAAKLIEKGAQRVFISLGPDGIYAAEKGCGVMVPRVPAEVLNTTGAGDAAAAAIVIADLKGMGLKETAELAARAGALTTEVTGTNNPGLSKILS